MFRKVLVILVALAMLCAVAVPVAVAAGQGEFTAGHYTSWEGAEPNVDSAVFKWIGDKTGVWFKEVRGLNGADPNQKISLETASNSLPDLILGETIDWSKLIDAGKVIQLDKYFKDAKNYPNLAKLDKKLIDMWRYQDGHVYKIPYQHAVSLKSPILGGTLLWNGAQIYVQSPLVKKAGMKLSDLSTMDGIEKFLKKAVTMTNADGQKCLGMAWDPISGWVDLLDGMFGIQQMNPTATGLNPDWTQPNYVKMVKWLSKLYAEGLIDQDAFTQSWDQYRGKDKTWRYALVFAHGGTTIDDTDGETIKKMYPDVNEAKKHLIDGMVAILPPKVPGIKTKPGRYFSVGGWGGKGIAKTCKNPDRLMKLFDYLYSKEGMVITYGVPGAGLQVNQDGTVQSDKAYWDKANTDLWKYVKQDGVWFWAWHGTTVVNSTSSTVNGKKLVFDPSNRGFAYYRKMDYGAIAMVKAKLVVPMPAWGSFTNRGDGAQAKYGATMTDISKNYFAKLVMAGSDSAVDKVYQDFKNEMESRGHASEVLQEMFQDYQAYLKTPGGKAANSVKLSGKFIDDGVTRTQPIEKGMPNTYYGDYSELVAKN